MKYERCENNEMMHMIRIQKRMNMLNIMITLNMVNLARMKHHDNNYNVAIDEHDQNWKTC